MKIARVIVNKTARAIDRLFDYIVPEALTEVLQIGMVVNVPFGKGNTLIEGYIVDFPESSNAENLKEIASILSKEALFDQSLLDVIYFMKKRYFSTYLSALKTVVPYGLGLSTRQDNGNF